MFIDLSCGKVLKKVEVYLLFYEVTPEKNLFFLFSSSLFKEGGRRSSHFHLTESNSIGLLVDGLGGEGVEPLGARVEFEVLGKHA